MQPTRVGILGMGTALPRHRAPQSDVCDWMCEAFAGDAAIVRRIRNIYAQSGIETRYTVCEELLQPADRSRFAPSNTGDSAPTTHERMLIYEEEAPKLAHRAAWQALNDCAARRGRSLDAVREEITHLVVVTCTGFFAPGLDFVLARDLGLHPSVRRTLIGFMGCAAAFNGLRQASEVVAGQPQANVLVVCVELCSLHIQPTSERSDLVAAALFGDAAAACVVGAASFDARETRHPIFELEAYHTRMKPGTEREMVWHIGDRGFALQLSPALPKHLESVAPSVVEQLFAGASPGFWAIHPGGRAIVDRLARIFELRDTEVASSRAVLRDIGNVSSATILFVLDVLRRQWESETDSGAGGERARSGIAMAFGPGLVIEAARLTYCSAPSRRPDTDSSAHPRRELADTIAPSRS